MQVCCFPVCVYHFQVMSGATPNLPALPESDGNMLEIWVVRMHQGWHLPPGSGMIHGRGHKCSNREKLGDSLGECGLQVLVKSGTEF